MNLRESKVAVLEKSYVILNRNARVPLAALGLHGRKSYYEGETLAVDVSVVTVEFCHHLRYQAKPCDHILL